MAKKSVTRILAKIHLKDDELDVAFNGKFNTIRIGTRHYDFERYRASATFYHGRGWTTREGDRKAKGTMLSSDDAKAFIRDCVARLYESGTRKGDLFIECLSREKVPLKSAAEALENLAKTTSQR